MNPNSGTAIIIGGGITGLSSAYYLHQSGWQVTIIDKDGFTDNCSYGNAGMIVPSHFTPMAAPGMISQGIKWMFNSKSPFYVKPSLSRSLLSWGLLFKKHATEKYVNRATPYLRDLNLYSRELYKSLAEDLKMDFDLQHKGILMLYKQHKTQDEEVELAHKAQQLGLDVDILNKDQVQTLEPDVQLDVIGATHYRCDSHLYPIDLMKNLVTYLKNNGAHFVNAAATDIKASGKKISTIITTNGSFTANQVVMTGGAWLGGLAKLVELKLPLMPGKGYSFMTDQFQQKLQHPALLLEARVAVTPMGGKVRIGGTMELAAINHNINPKRLQGIVESIPQYYPEYTVPVPDTKEVWHGFRPCSPDGLPYLGASTKYENLVIAGGLGMMGLSLGPATGKVVADILNGSPSDIKIDLFNPERFS